MRLQQRKTRQMITSAVIAAAMLLVIPTALTADDMLILPPEAAGESLEISDEQLQMFGIAVMSMQEIQLEANQEIDQVIGDSALSEERINEILQLQQTDPQSLAEAVPDEDLQEYEKTIELITEVHQEAQEDMVEAVTNLGFEVEEFNQMAQTIQEDPELMQRLQGMFMN